MMLGVATELLPSTVDQPLLIFAINEVAEYVVVIEKTAHSISGSAIHSENAQS